MLHHYLSYLCIRLLCYPLAWLSYRRIHKLGRTLGTLHFYCSAKRRKRALGNLSLAYRCASKPLCQEEKIRIAKEAFQNLAITCLELFRLQKSKGCYDKIVHFENFEHLAAIYAKGNGVILFAGHLASWEAPFLAITQQLKGVAIGKPLRNPYLYKWIVSIRERHGARLICPTETMHAGRLALKKGKFLAIVGDQAYLQSSYSYPLFGIRALTATSPAVLAYRTGAPILFTSIARKEGRYHVHFGPTLYADRSQQAKKEVPRLMDVLLAMLEQKIRAHPGQWLWQHNRWKQAGAVIKRRFRHDFLLIILPRQEVRFNAIVGHLSTLLKIYSNRFLTLFVPKGKEARVQSPTWEILTYEKPADLFIKATHYQMVIDLENHPRINAHFLKQGAFVSINARQMEKLSRKYHAGSMTFSHLAFYTFCKPHLVKDSHAQRTFLPSPATTTP